jgi:hypothetical protein
MQKTDQLTLPRNKAWVDFTAEEKKIFQPHIKSVSWKQEGNSGPVWVNFDIPEYDKFMKEWGTASCNYADSTSMGDGSGRKYSKWFSYSKAEKIARDLNVEFHP